MKKEEQALGLGELGRFLGLGEQVFFSLKLLILKSLLLASSVEGLHFIPKRKIVYCVVFFSTKKKGRIAWGLVKDTALFQILSNPNSYSFKRTESYSLVDVSPRVVKHELRQGNGHH